MNRHKDGRGLNDDLEIEASADRHSFKIHGLIRDATGAMVGKSEVAVINFQNGPRKQKGVNGVTTEALLTCVELYLEHVNKPPLNSRESSIVYTHVQNARLWAAERARSRQAAGTLGTMKP